MFRRSFARILSVSFVFVFLSALGSVQADPFELESPNADFNGKFGLAVSSVSDVNGDGRGDVVIGANGEDPGASPNEAGRAYIFDGSTGALLHTLASPNEENVGSFGQSVTGILDVNGDGRGDVVIGAYFEDPGASPSSAGRAYIFDGSTGALLRTLVSPNEEVDGWFGGALSGVSDFNGDGRGDVLVGASREDPGASPSEAGRAYIFDGSTGALIRTLVSPNEETSGRFGIRVSGVSDLNGDGRADVVIGAANEDPGASPSDAGRAYIFDGSTGALLRTLVSPNEETSGEFGIWVSGVSDVNGDGGGDVVIGAYLEDPGASPSGSGRAYIFDGSTGALLQSLASPNEAVNGGFGVCASGVSDFNGDGRGDVVIGAHRDDPGATPSDAGRAYIFDGSTGALLQTLVSNNEESGGRFGFGVSGVPDVDGDGLGEVVVGARAEDPGASPDGAGRAYLFSSIPAPEVWVDPPGPLAFGEQNINSGTTAAVIVTVTNIGNASLTFTGAEIALTGADASEFTLTADSGQNPLTPSATRTVQVAFDPSSAGLKSASLTITSDDTDDATVTVILTGTGIDQEIDVTGGPLVFGNQDLDDGATAGMQVTITNTGTTDLSFTGSEVALTGTDPGEFAITADSGEILLTPSATRTVQVAFDPSSVGLKSASLTITSDDEDEATVEISLSGTGIDQEIDVTGGPLIFGNQDIDDGPTAGLQVTITNTGTADLAIPSVSLSGADAGEFSITSDSGENSLTPSATRTVQVAFDPSSVGLKSADLTITSDDTDEATVEISLSGTGIDQEIDVTGGLLELESPNEEVGGDFGQSVSGVPDVNGDGGGDVVVGADFEDPGASPSEAGRAYIFDGATGALLQTLVSPNEEIGGSFGHSVSGVSDVDGDGFAEVVIGARGEDPGASPSSAGRAHLFDGSTGALLRTLVSPNEETSGQFGVSVSGVSDINGDGREDVVVGAYREDPGASPSDAGRAYLFDGSSGALLRTLVSPNEEALGRFGIRVSGVSDVNGDGRGDVVIGAAFEDPGASPSDAGRAYIFDGATGALLRTLVSPNEETSGEFGIWVSGVSDVNGDGRGDVVIGAAFEDPGASPSDAGRAYIFDGSSGALLQTLVSPNEEIDGAFGLSVSGVSDFNGDGRGDVVIGVGFEDPGASPDDAGRAYIFDGSTGVLLQTLASPNEESGGFFGLFAVSGVPDVDGDGLAEVVIGARNEDPGASPSGAGRAYIFSRVPSPVFGNQDIDDGATAGTQVTITNTGTADLAVPSVSLSGADAGEFSITSDSGENPLTPSATRTVRIAFDPSSVGLKSATLTITSDDTDEATVELPLSGTGTDQEIDVTPTSLAFGNQDIDDGPTAGMAVAVSNTGTNDLAVTSISMTGPNGGDFPISADSGENPIPPSGTRIVMVTFDPSTVGVKSASLTILSDDTDESSTAVSVTGTAFSIPTLPGPIGNPDFALKDLPDIRHAINAAGEPLTAVLDLDDYALDPDDRDIDGLALPLDWDKAIATGDDSTALNPANELQVSVPAQGAPSAGYLILAATDSDMDVDFVGPTIVKTADFLLGGPLVDERLYLGTPAATIPYTWCVKEGSAVTIPLVQSAAGLGKIGVSLTTGLGQTCFYSADTILDAAEQENPRVPYDDPIALMGIKQGPFSGASLLSGNLQIDGSTDGLVIEAQAGFVDWARVNLTRKFSDGSMDCYSVAIAEALDGTLADIDGAPETNTTAGGLAGSEDFEGITLQQFIGAASVAAFNVELAGDPATVTSRTAQETAWDVRGLGTTGSLPAMEITSVGKPAPSFPGATSGNALHCTFNAQDNNGFLAFHKGITGVSPGDILTFSLNLYFDAGYDGVNDDAINFAPNGLSIAMAVLDRLTNSMGSFNYVDFPIGEATQLFVQNAGVPGADAYTAKSSFLHGRWTRHQVSWRVPEMGQSVSGGPGGTGDLIDPTGIGAAWALLRGDTAAPVDQEAWVDNVCIANCPGPLAFALGAVNAPMISAGYSVEYGDGANAVAGLPVHAKPAALNRGELINGNFSTGNATAATAYPAGSPATFFRSAETAEAGWITAIGATGGNGAAYIGSGAAAVALGFPTGFGQSLVMESAVSTGLGGLCKVVSPYLDLGLIDQDINPGLHLDDVILAGGTLPAVGGSTLSANASGIYGLRFSARADGADPSENPGMFAILCNSDVTNGIVGQVGSQMLPNGADSAVAGVVWADYFVEGSFVSFHSPQTAAEGLATGAITAGDLAANPGRQMAQVQIFRVPYQTLGLVFTQIANGWEAYMGEVVGAPTAAQSAAAPGAGGAAGDLFVDEVGLYTVRDSVTFYDEDLCWDPDLDSR